MIEAEKSGEVWREAFRRFISRVDVASVKRAQWRMCCRAEERPAMQETLLQLAAGAQVGTLTDRLSLYKAAHAVLPLHGHTLREFIFLLLQEQPCPLEWCDAFLSALAECGPEDGALRQRLLNALRDVCARQAGKPSDLLRTRWIVEHIRLLKLDPGWLPPSK